jgi:hypothetical protein
LLRPDEVAPLLVLLPLAGIASLVPLEADPAGAEVASLLAPLLVAQQRRDVVHVAFSLAA